MSVILPPSCLRLCFLVIVKCTYIHGCWCYIQAFKEVSKKSKSLPGLTDYTNDQLFFISFAQVTRAMCIKLHVAIISYYIYFGAKMCIIYAYTAHLSYCVLLHLHNTVVVFIYNSGIVCFECLY